MFQSFRMSSKRQDKKLQRQPPRNRGSRNKYVTIRSLNGGRMLPTNDPPQVAYQPWNHITLAWYDQPSDHNFGDLVNELRKQIDPNNTGLAAVGKLAIQMKIHSIRVWNITGKTVALTVYDFHDSSDSDQLCGVMDAGSNTGIPRLGFEMPLSFRQMVMRNDSNTGKKKLYTVSAASSDTILQYIRMEWRFDGPVKGPSVDLNWERRLFETQVKALQEAKSTSQTVKKLLDAQPSTVERIIEGITHHAAEITMLAEDKLVLSNVVELLKELTVQSYDTLKDAPSCSNKQ